MKPLFQSFNVGTIQPLQVPFRINCEGVTLGKYQGRFFNIDKSFMWTHCVCACTYSVGFALKMLHNHLSK